MFINTKMIRIHVDLMMMIIIINYYNDYDNQQHQPGVSSLLEEEMNSTVQVKLRSSSRSGFIMDLITNESNKEIQLCV